MAEPAKAVNQAEEAVKQEEEIQEQINKDNAEEAAELKKVEDAQVVSNADPGMSGAMQAKKQQIIDKKEDAAELEQVEEMDAVNPESKANLAEALAGKMADVAAANKEAEEEAAELKQVEEMDAVNPESKANLEKALAGKMADVAAANKQADEEAAELKQVEEMDAVNAESKANLEEALAGKMADQAMANKQEEEEAAELKQVEEMDNVNPESKANLAEALAGKMADVAVANKQAEEEAAELKEVAEEEVVAKALEDPVPMSGAMQAKKQQIIDKKEDAAELKEVEEIDAVNPESKANLAAALAGKMADVAAANKQADEEAAELQEVAEEEVVAKALEDPVPMSGAMQAKKQQIIDKKEDAAELKEVEEMDPVNEESQANLADALAGKMAKQAMENKQFEEEQAELMQKQQAIDQEEDAAELKEVEEMDAVNAESKANLAEALAGKMADVAAANKQAEEEAAELKQVEEMDAVNPESKANLEEALARKMADVAATNKQADEEAAELKEVAEEEVVAKALEDPVPMSGAMQAKKQQIIDKKEDAAELEEVKAMDAVNPDSQAKMAEILAEKKQKAAAEEEVEAASPAAAAPGYKKTKPIYISLDIIEAMSKLNSNDGCRHVVIRIDEKKKPKSSRKRYYAELASMGDENLSGMISMIEQDAKQIYFGCMQIDTSDASGSNRTKYAFTQFIGEGIGPNTRAKVMSYLGEIKALVPKEDISLMGVDHLNYKTEYTPKNLAEMLHKSGSHKPDAYHFGSLGEYRIE